MNDFPRLPQIHSIETEQAFIGALLSGQYAGENPFELVPENFRAEHFYEPVHALIYESARGLYDRNERVSIVVLKSMLEQDVRLRELGGSDYLARLVRAATVTLTVADHANHLRDLYLRRQIVAIANEAEDAANKRAEGSPEELVQTLEDKLYQLHDKAERGRAVRLYDAVDQVIDRVARHDPPGVSTGLRDIDRRLGGLQPSNLIILGGRPSMGKTALGMAMAFNISARGPVLFVSLEMSSDQLAMRILSERSGIPITDLRRTHLNDAHIRNLVEISQELADRNLIIEDAGGRTIAQIRNLAKRVRARHGLALVVVDYLQLVSAGDRYRGNKVAEVTEISAALKALAKELRVPVLALAQLSRAVEQREMKRPMLSDLRESGAIEQDADVVLFVHREEYYLERAEPARDNLQKYEEWLQKLSAVKGKAEVICAKDRNGSTWLEELHFRGDLCRFGDLVR